MNAPDGPVLIAYDGSPSARCAVVDAARLMRSCPTLVVTVWEPGLAYASTPVPPDGITMTPLIEPEVARDVDRQMHDHADRISRDGAELARSLGLDAKPLAVPDEGDVSRTLLRVAEERQAAAIVVGSRGLSGLRARLEGSTSKSLLKHARCPVVVVHEHEQDGGPEGTAD
jgi:nucleotide-binding universal stress UspA family protein